MELKNLKNLNIRQAALFEHFLSHCNVQDFDTGDYKNENWGFFSFVLIDKSDSEERVLQRESFWQYELDTFSPKGLNLKDVPIM